MTSSPFIATTVTSATSLLHAYRNAFSHNARNSNIMYPHLLKVAKMERQGAPTDSSQFWIVCCSATKPDNVDFVLSCTDGPLGTYPIFIFSPRCDMNSDFITPRIKLLVETLLQRIDVRRAYSIFAVEPVSRAFANFWRLATGIGYYPEPYYAAMFSYCTRTSRAPRRQNTILDNTTYHLRRAVTTDIPTVTILCNGFASTADPFTQTLEQSAREAEILVNNQQLWVHTIKEGNMSEDIASIVAVTRDADSVAAITKVYTNPKWRARRCAERLVRYVCDQLLETKESVVLYVAHDNNAARKVYDRVGFLGLKKEAYGNVPGVEPWLEIGFDRESVDLGMW
ncbi:hypothetical protein BDQ12DRAFT_724793 [Crucibulum laeve]|uniref:N-acetyltransferase domain-containing protein n=1 Tax=Crucibulum laeve TaxID=68775 RepID=A0A5C3LW81_9AGAR|nr:hypothetical protein BDQ12DRAFT_724793 [Crucibulum laeve]